MSKSSVKSVPRRKHKSVTQADWVSMKDEQLLDMRMCDLKLSIEDSFLADMRNQLYAELAARNLRLKPHCWLSDDWFSPGRNSGDRDPVLSRSSQTDSTRAAKNAGS